MKETYEKEMLRSRHTKMNPRNEKHENGMQRKGNTKTEFKVGGARKRVARKELPGRGLQYRRYKKNGLHGNQKNGNGLQGRRIMKKQIARKGNAKSDCKE